MELLVEEDNLNVSIKKQRSVHSERGTHSGLPISCVTEVGT